MPEDLRRAILGFDRRGFLEVAAAGVIGVFAEAPAGALADTAGRRIAAVKKKLLVRSASPYNAEPALEHLVRSWITPVEHFYVRNHAPTPKLDANTFRLTVAGMVEKTKSFSIAELKDRFRSVTAIATLTCAGNRRNEHSRIKQVGGVQWDAGPIGNAEWTGVPLAELLRAVRLKGDAKHVWFESVDRIEKDGQVIAFGGSIPLDKALDESSSVPGAIVAFHMNGEPLLPDHGFPVRMVVPGYIGARSVKWLGKIVVSDRPSPNHYLANAYKLVTEGSEREWKSARPVYRFPINSAICTPAPNAKLASGHIRVAGYSLPAGVAGRAIARVETSIDGGTTWTNARLHRQSRDFCWRLWHADVRINRQTTQLIVRAVDTAGNVQPQTVPWNLKGYLFNAWHRVPVRVS